MTAALLRCPRGHNEEARPPGHTLTCLWRLAAVQHRATYDQPADAVHSPLTCCADQTCNLEPETTMSQNGNGTPTREFLSGQILARIPEPATLHQVTAGMKGDWGIGEGETNGLIGDLVHAKRLRVVPGEEGGDARLERVDGMAVPPVASRDAEGVNLHEALLDLVAAEPRSRDKLVQAARKAHGGEIPDWTRRIDELARTGRIHTRPKGKGHQYAAGSGPGAAPTGDARAVIEDAVISLVNGGALEGRTAVRSWLEAQDLSVPDAEQLIQGLINSGRLTWPRDEDEPVPPAGDPQPEPQPVRRPDPTGPVVDPKQPDLFDEPDDVRQLRIESKALARVQQLLQARQYQRDRIKDLKEEMSAAKESLAGIEAQLDTFDFPKAPASAPTICKVEPVDQPLPLGPPVDPQPVAPEVRLDLPEHTPQNPQPFTEREGEIFEGELETSTHGDGTGGEGHDVRTHGDGSRDLDAEQAEMDREMAHQD